MKHAVLHFGYGNAIYNVKTEQDHWSAHVCVNCVTVFLVFTDIKVKIVYFTPVTPPEHLEHLFHHHIPQIWVIKSRKGDLDPLQPYLLIQLNNF